MCGRSRGVCAAQETAPVLLSIEDSGTRVLERFAPEREMSMAASSPRAIRQT